MDKYRLPPNNIVEAHQDVNKRVSKMERNPRLGNSSIDSGGLSVRSGNFSYVDPSSGQMLVRFGDVGAPLLRGWIFRRLNGFPAFYINGTPGGDQFWTLVDMQGNFVMSDDIGSGQGIATPYIPLFGISLPRLTNPEATTSTTAFVGMYRIHGVKQQPKISTDFVATTPNGVTAEVQIVDLNRGSTVIAGPLSISANTPMTYFQMTGAIQGGHLSGIILEVQMRVASGVGTVGMSYVDAFGRQT